MDIYSSCEADGEIISLTCLQCAARNDTGYADCRQPGCDLIAVKEKSDDSGERKNGSDCAHNQVAHPFRQNPQRVELLDYRRCRLKKRHDRNLERSHAKEFSVALR